MSAGLVVCPVCARTYGGLVDPSCAACGGAGTVSVPPGDHGPRVAARAVQMVCGWAGADLPARMDAARRAGLIVPKPATPPERAWEPDLRPNRPDWGRAAGRLARGTARPTRPSGSQAHPVPQPPAAPAPLPANVVALRPR